MPTTKEERWAAVLGSTGKGGRLQRHLVVNRSRNWLAAITAHACRKAMLGIALSDLESQIVQTLRAAKRGDYLVESMAHVYTATPAATRAKMFPAEVSDLKPEDSITMAGLGKMAPAIVKEMTAQANYRDVDVAAVHRGEVPRLEALRIPRDVTAAHRSTIVRAVSKGGSR